MSRFFKVILLPSVFILLGAGCFNIAGEKEVLPDGGVYKSVDGGETWTQSVAVPTAKGVGSIATVSVLSVAGDPHHAATVYAATISDGLFVSYDAGVTWRRMGNIGQTITRITAVDPVEPCVLYASTGSRIMKSRDCGRVWESVYEVPVAKQIIREIVIAPNNRMKVYAGLSDGVFVASQNGGGSWSVLHRFGSVIRGIVINPKNPARMYVVTEKKGLWRSNDGGGSWEQLSEQLKPFTGANRGWRLRLDPIHDNVLLYGSMHGLLKSTNGGDAWNSIPLITAPGEARIYGLAYNPNNNQEIYYSAVVGGKPLLYKTVDGGANWQTIKLPTTRIPVSIYIRPNAPNEVFLGMYQAQK